MATMLNTQELPFTLQIWITPPVLNPDGSVQTPGVPGQIQGVPVYATSDATIAIVTNLSPDGLSGVFQAVAPSQNPVRMTVTGDADLGAGVTTITGVSEDCTVTQDPAQLAHAFSFTFGPAQAKS